MFELVTPLPLSSTLRAGGPVLRTFEYRNDHERDLVAQVFGYVRKKQARIHLLQNGDDPYGFVALSIQEFNRLPAVKIEYLFTSDPYRSLRYNELGDSPLSVAGHLMGHAISMANSASTMFSIRNMFLQLADERLDPYYTNYGFSRLTGTDLMFLVLPTD